MTGEDCPLTALLINSDLVTGWNGTRKPVQRLGFSESMRNGAVGACCWFSGTAPAGLEASSWVPARTILEKCSHSCWALLAVLLTHTGCSLTFICCASVRARLGTQHHLGSLSRALPQRVPLQLIPHSMVESAPSQPGAPVCQRDFRSVNSLERS